MLFWFVELVCVSCSFCFETVTVATDQCGMACLSLIVAVLLEIYFIYRYFLAHLDPSVLRGTKWC